VRKLTTSAVDAGAGLAAWLAARLGLAAGEARRRVAAGAVYVGGRRAHDPDLVLAGSERIVVHEPRAAPDDGWRVVHEEAGIVVVDKPAGLPVTRGRAGGAALEPLVAGRFPGARAFHRIDQDTSGLVLFARGDGARRLAAALAAGRLEREYLAVVAGAPPDVLCLDAPIGPDPADRRRMKAGVPGGKPARTDVTVVRRVAGRALVRARLSTGLTHQIRVHLAGVGHPVLGDTVYGGPPAARLALHATRLGWPGGEAASPLPADLDALVA
jgi:23S rRNA pseudouridine1911/1915/1917 synthase